MSPNDALTFSVAERNLNRRIDELSKRIGELEERQMPVVKLTAQADMQVKVNYPKLPNWPGRIALLALVLSIVAVVAVLP